MHSKLVKFSARFCLIAQLTGILSGALFPVMVLAQQAGHQVLFASKTVLYTLRDGDTVGSVAKQFGLTVDELKKINQFRKYSKPFVQLGIGDEVDVPAPDAVSLTSSSPSEINPSPASRTDDNIWAAPLASAGALFGAEKPGKQAVGMATSAAANSVEKWLNQFGTAQVQLNLTDEYKLDGTAVDLLLPWYDSTNNLIFNQLGYRNKDSSNTVNLGLGIRSFQNAWMYGANIFYDDDLNGHNRRIGFGVEAWTDYLKLSANSYSSMTNWHQSRDFADYNERPADGFDIRAEGYLPVYPQLGSKLIYEQYRGGEVALFSQDNRSHDPQTVTIGVNYTPIPLVTLGVDYRQGQGSQSDTKFNLEFNYRLGEPWSTQTEASMVDFSRTLAGSHYDLVARNNDIVLEYQKQTLIRLNLPEIMTGKAGNSDNLTATVEAKYDIARVEWDYHELIAAGGAAKSLSQRVLQITYPPYHSAGNNIYQVSAVAYDINGNQSNRSVTNIEVSKPEAEIARGDLTVAKDNAKANGVDTNAVRAKVTDASHHPVSGITVTFAVNNGASIITETVVTDANGLASTTLISATAGVATVTATVNSSRATVDTHFVADATTAEIKSGSLVINPNNVPANGTDANVAQVKVTDANGNPVPNMTVTFSAPSDVTVVTAASTTNTSGIATTNLTSSKVGTFAVTASVNGSSQVANAIFMPVNTTVEIKAGNLVVTQNNAKANGTAANVVEAKVTDANGNPVPNMVVTFSAPAGVTVVNTSVFTNANGIATTALHSVKAGTYAVTASVNTSSQAVNVVFVADAATATTTLVSNVAEQISDGTSVIVLTATVKDAQNNIVGGEHVVFATTGSAKLSGTPSTVTVTTNAQGQAIINLTDMVAEGVTVAAKSTINASDKGDNLNLTFTSLPPVIMPSSTRILVNGATFAVDQGFPKTGFKGAKFQFAIKGDTANNTNYRWSSDTSWVSVSNLGIVTFVRDGSSSEVTITATPIAGGAPLKYKFALNRWFINHGKMALSANEADDWCSRRSSGGYSTPSYREMTNAGVEGDAGTRSASSGQLWPEWGRVLSFFDGWEGVTYWTSDAFEPYRNTVNLYDGTLGSADGTYSNHVACSKRL